MDLMLPVLLIVLVVVGLAVALLASRPVDDKRNPRHCVHCGAELETIAGRATPICHVCGRKPPGAEKVLTHHGHG